MENELISKESILKKLIDQGSVFNYKDDEFNSDHRHFFVVLNIDPKKDEAIYMVHAESISPSNYHFGDMYKEETLVQVSGKKECPFVNHPTVFNCNNVQKRSYKDLLKKYCDGALSIKDNLSNDLLNKIIDAAVSSEVVDEDIKIKIKPGYEPIFNI